MSRRKVPELDTPFSAVEWPAIPQDDQDAILEILCALLAPLGQHRRDHVTPSLGQRSRRRQKAAQKKTQQEAERVEGTNENSSATGTAAALSSVPPDGPALPPLPPPPPPALAAFVDVGLTAVTRELAAAASSLPSAAQSSSSPSSPPYAAVFVVRSGHPSAFYSHLPQMVAVASRNRPSKDGNTEDGAGTDADPIRLVGFSRACEDRLRASLGVPRVSCIGLRAGAPQAQGLLELLREKVPPVEIRWLEEAKAGQFLPTQVHVADVRVGPKKRKRV